MLLALITAVVAMLVVLGLYLHIEWKLNKPTWRRLPSRPGLPPDMEYQCWSVMTDFDASLLSDAVVHVVDLLSPVLGRAVVFAALRGSRLLIYRDATYPGNECGPAASGVVVLAPRWAAVEMRLGGLAHALVHLVERHSGAADYGHATWEKRGILVAVALYEERRRQNNY